MNFYSLFYIAKKDSNPNLIYNNNDEKFKIYLNNASNLYLSLKKIGYNLILLTNNPKKIRENLKYNIKVINLNFKTAVPKKIKFYSAHFKLDVFKYLSKKNGYNCLLDLDIIAINRPPRIFKKNVKKKTNMLYNLNQNYNDLNNDHNKSIIKSLKYCNKLNDNTAEWYGGEFIAGSNFFFKKIYTESNKLLNNYLKYFKILHHQGDEMIVNSAIQKLKKNKKFKYKDISNEKIITRYWSINTLHKQKDINFHLKNFLIHLPADKKFLSRLDIRYNNIKEIHIKVKKHLNSYSKKFENFFKRIYKILIK